MENCKYNYVEPKTACMNQKKLLSKFFLMPLLLASVLSFGQNKISGTITNENGDGLEGATLQIKETSDNAVAAAGGKYSLSSQQQFPWTIVINYVGYLPKEVIVSKTGTYNLSLTEIALLEGVTIVGTRGEARTDVKRPVGSNNITDVYPDKVLPTLAAYGTGQTPYNRNVNQFGFAGAFYYGSLTVRF